MSKQDFDAAIGITEYAVRTKVNRFFKERGALVFPVAANRGRGRLGISDVVGCVPLVITPEMVGKKIGVFVACEIKRPGRRNEKHAGASAQQLMFLKEVIEAYGCASLADCYDDMWNAWTAYTGALALTTDQRAGQNALLDARTRKKEKHG